MAKTKRQEVKCAHCEDGFWISPAVKKLNGFMMPEKRLPCIHCGGSTVLVREIANQP